MINHAIPQFRSAAAGPLYFQSPLGTVLKVYPAEIHTTPPAVTGSRAANAALTSLLTVLATAGVVTDSTTA